MWHSRNIGVITLLLIGLTSCFHSNSEKQLVKDSLSIEFSAFLRVQSHANILGDKVILSNNIDVNGFKSPDTIYLIQSLPDSASALKFMRDTKEKLEILNVKKYYFEAKSADFIVFSRTKPVIESKKKIFYRIRANNFRDGDSLLPVQLSQFYKNYVVIKVVDDNLYIIKPKKSYLFARMFTRLIKYNDKNTQIANLTLNDFDLVSVTKVNSGYILALNRPWYGASQDYFTDSKSTAKLVWINNELKVQNDFQIFDNSTTLLKVQTSSNNETIASFHCQTGCSICYDDFYSYDVYFNENNEAIKLEMTGEHDYLDINTDSLLFEINRLNQK